MPGPLIDDPHGVDHDDDGKRILITPPSMIDHRISRFTGRAPAKQFLLIGECFHCGRVGPGINQDAVLDKLRDQMGRRVASRREDNRFPCGCKWTIRFLEYPCQQLRQAKSFDKIDDAARLSRNQRQKLRVDGIKEVLGG